jgi:hypothetical protein
MDLSDAALRSIVAHLAHLRAEYGEVLADPELVEPNGEYFPDEFALEPAAIDRLMRRMLTYAPLAHDLEVGLAFMEPEEEQAGGGCGSGACSPGDAPKQVAHGGAVETPDGYAVVVHTQDVGEPTLLTASLARSAGRLVLFEADEEVDPRDEGPMAELTAVASGLGLLLLNGACVYKKGCGGMRKHQGTFLSVEELSFALALFIRVRDIKAGVVRRHLEVTQREAFDAALDWVDGQPKLVATLKDHPERLVDGVFAVEQKKGFLSRLLGGRATADDEVPENAIAAKARARSAERTEEERRRIAEARALVDEALQER